MFSQMSLNPQFEPTLPKGAPGTDPSSKGAELGSTKLFPQRKSSRAAACRKSKLNYLPFLEYLPAPDFQEERERWAGATGLLHHVNSKAVPWGQVGWAVAPTDTEIS